MEWSVLKPEIFASIMDFFASNVPILTEEQPPSDTGACLHSKIVYTAFSSIQSNLHGPVPRKMVKFEPRLSQISSTDVSCLTTCYSRLQNTVEPLLRDALMITQNATLSNA